MRLRDLFSDDATIDPRAEAVTVSGLAADSRAVKPGDLFFALAGTKTDGARFIDSAISAGAVAVAGNHPPPDACRVPFVATPNPRRALALASAKFFSRQPRTIAAVTGTSGKTSVAAFTRQIWQRLGHASASIGSSTKSLPKASPISLSKRPRTDSINIGWTACASAPAALPTCRATTWIT